MAPSRPRASLTIRQPADLRGAAAEALLFWLWTTGTGVLVGGLIGPWLPAGMLPTVLAVWAVAVASWAATTRAVGAAATRIEIDRSCLCVWRELGALRLRVLRVPLAELQGAAHVEPHVLELTRRSADPVRIDLPRVPPAEIARLRAALTARPTDPGRALRWKALDRARSDLVDLLERPPPPGR